MDFGEEPSRMHGAFSFECHSVIAVDARAPGIRVERSNDSDDPLVAVEVRRSERKETCVFALHGVVRRDAPTPVSVGLEWTLRPWSERAYVLMPGAVYAGNRFEAVRVPYSPRYPAERAGPDMPTIVSDVPRLERDSGSASLLELLSGDMAWPAAGFWDPDRGRAFLWTAPSHTAWAETGWTVLEPSGRTGCVLRIMAPGVRSQRYVHMRRGAPSEDAGHPARAGNSVILEVTMETWEAPDLNAFFERVFERCHGNVDPAAIPPVLSFSRAREILTEKYQRENWKRDWGLYLTVTDSAVAYPYQTGWCGGGIAARALLGSPNADAAARAHENIDRICREGRSPCGLIHGKRTAEGWVSDFHGQTGNPHTRHWTLTRRQGDALYYLGKSVLVRGQQEGARLSHAHPWTKTLRGLAEVLARIFRTHGQWGHFLHQETGEVLVGGTASGGIIPAGLALAADILDEPALLRVAAEGATHYLERFTSEGLTTGGPADALGNPDSESAAALLESYMALHAATGDARWLGAARAAAHQLGTWVMPYAYPFPVSTEFGRLRMNTIGTVFANAQNKHSAPGICTHSGEGLLRLYRATGERAFLNLLTAVARTLPQYLSRSDRPVRDPSGRPLPPGWINERVNTSDWDNNLGGVFHGSCWCEVSLMLTTVELPGVYWQPATNTLAVLDHVEATVVPGGLRLRNPFAHEARVRVMVEEPETARRPLNHVFADSLPEIPLPAHGSVTLPVAELLERSKVVLTNTETTAPGASPARRGR